MTREEGERLIDIRVAINSINEHLERVGDPPNPELEQLLHDALQFQFVVIGEAVKSLTEETCASEPDVKWRNIAGLRDLIAHHYYKISTEQILDIARKEVPPLDQAITRLIGY